MKYSTHKIKKTGHIELRQVIEEKDSEGEVINETFHRSVIAPNEPIPETYKSKIEADENFAKYRTQENSDKYEAKLKELEPTTEELEKQIEDRINQEAEQAMREIKEEILQEMLNQVYAEKESLTDEQVLAEPKKVKPFKIGTDYKTGDRFYYPRNKKLYKVLQPHKSAVQWLPNEAVSLYVEVTPEGVIDDWVQPTDATNAYNTGEKVNYKGKVWISKIDANTTVPDGDVPHNRYWEPFTG